MATVRALPLALLLALCFGACACEAAARMPKSRYISYARVITHQWRRGGNGAGHGRTPPGCSSFTGKCPNSCRAPTEAGATTAAAGSKGVYMMNHAALPSDDKHRPAPTKAGAKTGAAGSKGRYISPAAMSAEKPCDRLGCPSRP
ncbi:uncharacterized protein LOC111257198 [Setaria italica]|uniref:uncharacterized protein LOC111257198 n=1 Tax=Setaria italica TaxID=4555 RepID=UPI000BE4CE55|nr:uncharacterized protein LOC111257198 [Setaria italica]